MMHLYSALLCIAVHPKHFTIMGGVFPQPSEMKVLAKCITNQKIDIFTVENVFMEHDLNIQMIFGIK